eukprot:2740815-Rhodomonas_salina.2
MLLLLLRSSRRRSKACLEGALRACSGLKAGGAQDQKQGGSGRVGIGRQGAGGARRCAGAAEGGWGEWEAGGSRVREEERAGEQGQGSEQGSEREGESRQ